MSKLLNELLNKNEKDWENKQYKDIESMPIKQMCVMYVHEDGQYDPNCHACAETTYHRNTLPHLLDWLEADLAAFYTASKAGE